MGPFLLCVSLGQAFLASAQTTQPALRPGPPIPPLRPATVLPAGPSLLRITAQRGEVFLDKGGKGEGAREPLQPTSTLAAHDELQTKQGTVELLSPAGVTLRIGEGSHVALLSPMAIYLARGELSISMRPGKEPVTLSVSTPCGRTPVKAREAMIRVDGTSTMVSMYDGTAFLGGYPPAGTVVQSGQSNRCVKGEPLLPARPILAAPSWMTGSELVLVGDGGSPTEVTLRWQVVPTAQRYRVELYRKEGENEVWLSNSEASSTRPQVELRELEAGSYVARVYAWDENGAFGQVSDPHSFLLVRVGGLGLDGTIRTEAGVMPRVNTPPGMPAAVLLDGTPPAAGAPSQGQHQLRVMVGGLSADARLVAAQPLSLAALSPTKNKQPKEEPAQPEPPRPTFPSPFEEPPSPPSDPSSTLPLEKKSSDDEPVPPNPADERPLIPQAGLDAMPLDDVLLGGVGEVPFDGIRSPWAGSYVGARVDTTVSGSLRVVAAGRYTMRNGFGFDVSVAALRAAIDNRVATYSPLGFGNINAGLRSPTLRRQHLALQGIFGLVGPSSTSFLDTSTEVDGGVAGPDDGISAFRTDVRPRGGGWRLEPGVLFGVRLRSLTLSTMQGISLRVAPRFSGAYAGGLVAQIEILPSLRFLSFASWQVNYVGESAVVDAGGALGGGFEALIPGGHLGKLKLGVLGRMGLGVGGAAVYGRGAVGLQLGYRFN